jgi:hypothetical protein
MANEKNHTRLDPTCYPDEYYYTRCAECARVIGPDTDDIGVDARFPENRDVDVVEAFCSLTCLAIWALGKHHQLKRWL